MSCVSSASAMNVVAGMVPNCAWCHRTRASTPTTRPVAISTCGWYATVSWSASRAACKGALEHEPIERRRAHVRAVDLHRRLAVITRPRLRGLGVLEQHVGVAAMLGIERNPGARAHAHLDPLDHERRVEHA